MREVSRGNRAAVRGLERPVADPHSMAFSYGTTGNTQYVQEVISAICNPVLDVTLQHIDHNYKMAVTS